MNPDLARETYLEALTAAVFAGSLAAPGSRPHEVATAASAAPPARMPRVPDLLLDGFAAMFSGLYGLAAPVLRQAQSAIEGMSQTEQLRWMWGATVAAQHLWDDEGWEHLSSLHLEMIRETGRLADLAIALGHRGQMHVFAGELTLAASRLEAVQEATELTGSPLAQYHGVSLAAMRGREAEARQIFDSARADVIERGEGAGLAFADWAESILYNGLSRYADALAAARRVVGHTDLVCSNWAMPELIEAAARVGAFELATEADEILTERASASGTEWALGIAARSHALLADDARAADLYVEAIDRLGRTSIAVDLARAHLLYGEWLRRDRQLRDARNELRSAYEMFTAFGMEAFAERTRVELRAAGERVQAATAITLDQLTPQELQVARNAAEGKSNREIAALLFISPSTVEYHLHKAFRKLDVKSRTQLAQRKMPGQTALVANRLSQIIAEVESLPTGVVNIFTESGNAGAPYLVASPDVQVISYTGSVPVGRIVAAEGAPTLKRMNLELGGKTPMIIFDDADVAACRPLLTSAVTTFAGQFCMTGSRILVQRGVADQVRAGLKSAFEKVRLGDGLDPATQTGPLIDKPNVARVDEMVETALVYAKPIGAAVRPPKAPLRREHSFGRPCLRSMTSIRRLSRRKCSGRSRRSRCSTPKPMPSPGRTPRRWALPQAFIPKASL